MKKQIEDLTNEENRMLIDDLQARHILAADMHPGCWFESDATTAFNSIEENERARLAGDNYDLVLIGPARALDVMRPIINRMVIEENEYMAGKLKSEDRKLKHDPGFGIWETVEHNKHKLHSAIPDYPDPPKKKQHED